MSKKEERKKIMLSVKERAAFIYSSGDVSIADAARKTCEELQIPFDDTVRRSISKYLKKVGLTNSTFNNTIEDTDVFKDAKNKEIDKSKSRFIFSWCQSETEIHEGFLNNIEKYAEHIDASIHIIAGRYKNPTSIQSNKNTKAKEKNLNNSWHPRVIPYLDANRHKIHDNLCLLSDVKIQPTASTPLSGLNGMTGLESCIVGHPRVHLKSLPILDGYPHKLLLSTGSVSVENYTDTKSGKKGEFHHTLGFVIVEIDGDSFHIRQVQCEEDGSFYDLKYFVSDGEIMLHSGVEAIVFGDLHLGETNPDILEQSFVLSDYLKCKDIVLHDVFNGHSISHHERMDPFILMKREADGTDDLDEELSNVIQFFDLFSEYNFVMVRSNHDEFLDRWLKDVDWRKTINKKAYLRLANLLSRDDKSIGIVPMFLSDVKNVTCLGIDDSYRINEWECGMHGHIGSNGSRGGVIQFKNLNTKNVTGHTHTPCREDGHCSVGTLTHLRVGYNKGASSWMNSNFVIYPNGKGHHVHIINNKFTTL
ncbi:hypothetical protein [Flavobacterium sp.]|uniref:hypothetical protein n=1 Tax=Flavobacterium sp. TaxID=239 RepID=UPI0025FF4BBD|nr:hypothetical protein [Flavobacterium sp.]